jgi:TrmH family RNA methyltransferase
MEKITSLQNPTVKRIVQLSKSKERREQGLFVMEGARELSLAKNAGYEVESVFVCPEIFANSEYPGVLNGLSERIITEITPAIFEKLAYREHSDGIIALMRPKNHNLSSLSLPKDPFIIVLEAVEKPGNLGAILRTADAAKADAVIVCDPNTDIYNPNVIRSSIGCLFTVPVGVCSSTEAYDWLQSKQVKTYAAELTAAKWYHVVDFRGPSAIIMGTEADGLTPFWLDAADTRIKIPMRGAIDSLNVSVSTAILTFEAMRQRGF